MSNRLALAPILAGCEQDSPDLASVKANPPLASPTALPALDLGTSLTIAPTPPIPYRSPDWFKRAVVYEIFVRSFADSDGDGIGDLNGITQRLDYIQSLGANTIWLTPIYPSPSYHGYDVTDFFSVNPDYGTLEDFRSLVKAVHERAMRIILDFVPSHLSNQHPLFQDSFKNPASKTSDWFVFTNDANTTYAGFAGHKTMPRFNHFNPEVVDYLSKAALFWLDLDGDGDTTDGVDGFRVDNATFPPQEYLIALRQAVKRANPNALLLGEVWVHSPSDLGRYYQDQFDALFDFPMQELLQGNKDSIVDGLLAGKGYPILLTTLLADEAQAYPQEGLPVRFLSNHDTNRVSSGLEGNPQRQRLAIALLASLPGPLMVYYGEEIGMPGQRGGPPDWDKYRREPMDWYANECGPGQTTWFKPDDRWNRPWDGVSVEEQDSDPGSLLNYYRMALKTRLAHPALFGRDYEVLELDVSGPGPWGILRLATEPAASLVLAIFNFADEQRQVAIKAVPFSAEKLVDILSGVEYPCANEGQPYRLTLPPATGIWLSGG